MKRIANGQLRIMNGHAAVLIYVTLGINGLLHIGTDKRI
jgi:hypothetical protein